MNKSIVAGLPVERPGNGIYNMVVEIPRWTNAKMEVRSGLSSDHSVNPG